MIGWIRNIIIILLVLTVIYIGMSLYKRWQERTRLKDEYEAANSVKAPEEDKADYIADGMRDYNRSIRPKLIAGVYIVPFAILLGLIYLAQNN